MAWRDGDGEAGRNGMACAWSKDNVFGRDDIHAGSAVAGIGRQRQSLAMRQAIDRDPDHFFFAFRLAGFFDGPLATLASIRATASSSVTAFGSAVLGSVAWVAPSLTYGPYRPAMTLMSLPLS